jgi:hypothetical protein
MVIICCELQVGCPLATVPSLLLKGPYSESGDSGGPGGFLFPDVTQAFVAMGQKHSTCKNLLLRLVTAEKQITEAQLILTDITKKLTKPKFCSTDLMLQISSERR